MANFLELYKPRKMEVPKKVSTRGGVDPTVKKRNNLIAGIDQQIEAVTTEIAGEKYQAFKKDKKTGKTVPITKWSPWFFESDGTWATVIRYGQTPLKFDDDITTIPLGKTLASVKKAYEVLKANVAEGAFDVYIKKAATREKK